MAHRARWRRFASCAAIIFGFYREVRVKHYDSMLARTLVAARTRLIRVATELSNQIRGLMKTFGRAALAVARKLSVIMHKMLTTGEIFNRSAGAIA
jgi:transposase